MDHSWDQAVPALFIGGSYCKNWSDVGRAFEWMVDLRRRGIGWKEAERQLRAYMATENWGAQHIEAQVDKAREGMKPWLLD
jgi:hypothetical protein